MAGTSTGTILLNTLCPEARSPNKRAANDATCGERVLILTAISEAELRKLPAGLAVWRVIRKPCDNADLVRSVNACRLHEEPSKPRMKAAV